MRPNLLLIGAARSGTTALARQLAGHDDVFFVEPKEVHFFAHARAGTRYRGPGDAETVNRALVSDPDQYLKLFEGGSSASVRCDGSVSTLYFPEASIPAIAEFADPDAKLIALLREPVARAYSSYLYLIGRGYEKAATFAEGLDLEHERIASGHHHMWHYRSMSRYAEQLQPFVDAFGDRLKVMIFEEFRAEPLKELNGLLEFAGVGPMGSLPIEHDVNRGGVPRSWVATQAIATVRRSGTVLAATRRLVPRSVRDRVRAANLARPEMDAELRRALADEFAKDVAFVEQVLGREVPAWRRS